MFSHDSIKLDQPPQDKVGRCTILIFCIPSKWQRKKQAKVLLAQEKVDDIKATEVTLKLLSVIQDHESAHH